jgi:hypothetical protein
VKAKPFLIFFFAVVVVVAAVSIYVSQTVRKADKTVAALASPDGRYKAVKVSLRRGGLRPFCFDSVSVFLSVYPDSFAESEKIYEVYRAPCAPPDRRADLPKLQWLSDSALQIAYAPDPSAPAKEKPLLKPLDASKFVHVTFVAQ